MTTLRADQITTEDSIDVCSVLDFYDQIGVTYDPHARLIAEEMYAPVLDPSSSDKHTETGEPITVLYTDQGNYAVPADLLIRIRS